jgi:hypothetical protein
MIAAGDGFTVKADHAADHVQIFFDDKPAEDLCGALKAADWHWSRSEGAWQRKLTDAAIEQAQADSAELEQGVVYTRSRHFQLVSTAMSYSLVVWHQHHTFPR